MQHRTEASASQIPGELEHPFLVGHFAKMHCAVAGMSASTGRLEHKRINCSNQCHLAWECRVFAKFLEGGCLRGHRMKRREKAWMGLLQFERAEASL